MITRFRLTAFVFLACLAVALVTEARRVPVSQIDLFLGSAVGVALSGSAVTGVIRRTLDTLPHEMQMSFQPAGESVKGVEITPLAQKRERIRVASHDRAAANLLADRLRHAVVAAGVDEQFSLSFTSSGGVERLLVLLATLLAGLTFLVEAAVRWHNGRSSRRPVPAVMRGAASI